STRSFGVIAGGGGAGAGARSPGRMPAFKAAAVGRNTLTCLEGGGGACAGGGGVALTSAPFDGATTSGAVIVGSTIGGSTAAGVVASATGGGGGTSSTGAGASARMAGVGKTFLTNRVTGCLAGAGTCVVAGCSIGSAAMAGG